MAKIIDWYRALLTAAEAKGCIINILREEQNVECWLLIEDKKYKYRSWKIGQIDEHLLTDEWLQAIYMKTADGLRLLNEMEVRMLYDDLDLLEATLAMM